LKIKAEGKNTRVLVQRSFDAQWLAANGAQTDALNYTYDPAEFGGSQSATKW